MVSEKPKKTIMHINFYNYNNGNYKTTKNIEDVAERTGGNLFVVCP